MQGVFIVLHAVENPDARSADCGVGEQGMRVGSDPFQQFRQGSLFQVVDVHQSDGSPSADMFPLLAALKTDGNGKAGTGRFLFVGSSGISLRSVVTVFKGMFLNSGILSDHPDDFTECCVRR